MELTFSASCGQRDTVLGNPHTFLGRFNAECPHDQQYGRIVYSSSADELVDPLEELTAWIDGYLCGQEPEPGAECASNWLDEIAELHRDGGLAGGRCGTRFREGTSPRPGEAGYGVQHRTPGRYPVSVGGVDQYLVVGNPHTAPGEIALGPAGGGGGGASRVVAAGEALPSAPGAAAWLAGYLAGAEVEPPLDQDGYDLDDEYPRTVTWRTRLTEFRRTGIWPGEVGRDVYCACE